MEKSNHIIDQTENWIKKVVIELNFCPFAAKPVREKSIHYEVLETADFNTALQTLIKTCMKMDDEIKIDTAIIIFPNQFQIFDKYLELVELSENLLKKEGYEGIYQVASFHPLYQFAGSDKNDAENYTNRSPYPMLHLLREDQIEKALKKYPNPETIPQNNISTAKLLGLENMKKMWEDSFK